MNKKVVILFTVLLLLLNGCMQKNEIRHVATPPSALTTAPINEKDKIDLLSPTPKGTELVASPNSEISFLEKADFDGDGNDEAFIIRKTDLADTIVGYIDVSFLKDGETLVYAIEETETLSYQEKVLIANFDDDSLPEVFLCTDISGYSRGRGYILKFSNGRVDCIFNSKTQDFGDTQVNYIDGYSLLVTSSYMIPETVVFTLPLDRYVDWSNVYDDEGIAQWSTDCFIDSPHSITPVAENGQYTLRVEQYCSGLGGRSNTLGVLTTVLIHSKSKSEWIVSSVQFELT